MTDIKKCKLCSAELPSHFKYLCATHDQLWQLSPESKRPVQEVGLVDFVTRFKLEARRDLEVALAQKLKAGDVQVVK